MNAERTLLDLFARPDGLVGQTAVLVAMTGTPDFLDEIAETFTGMRSARRSQRGAIQLFVLLDGHRSGTRTAVLEPGQVPGMHELQPRSVGREKLTHAKLALLGFGPSRTGAPTRVRLAILTANYTATSARQQLELVWSLEVALETKAPAIERADLAAAATFVTTLMKRRYHPDPAITGSLEGLLATCSELAPERTLPRFIHSLDEPLLPQMRTGFARVVDSTRNVLVCGSGFYERPLQGSKKPHVLAKLEDITTFTSKPCRVAVIDPGNAAAVAAWSNAGPTEGWDVKTAVDATELARTLHAKFVYAGYWRDQHFSNGCLYLGSGNLSRRGLLTSGVMDDGNIECGVVLAVPERLSTTEIKAQLFWDPDDPVLPGHLPFGKADDGPDDAPLIVASPILSATIATKPARALVLHWRDDVGAQVEVTLTWPGRAPMAILRSRASVALEENDRPSQLEVSDGTGAWRVPVIDADGRVAWQPPRYETPDDALAAMLDFAIDPSDESDDDDGDDEGGDDDGGGDDDDGDRPPPPKAAPAGGAKTYALHVAAELIEAVAALQRQIPPSRLDDWLEHLERTLHGSFPPALIEGWRAHGIDVCRHLQAPALRPPEMSSRQRTRYERILTAAATDWGLR